MKKRLLALALAAAMIYSSFNAAVAGEADVNTESVQTADNVVSGGSIDKDYIWKAALLGQSAAGASGIGTSYITLTTKAGGVQTSDRYASNIEPQIMTNGKFDNVESVQLDSWDGCGKLNSDQDGIAYFYTKVSNKNNFKLSADFHVNRYIREVDKLTTWYDIENYNSYYAEAIADGYSDAEAKDIALDRMRSGQEAFGIMARDVIPYAGGVVDGQYMGDICMRTTSIENALKSDITYTAADGTVKTVETPVDIYEAYTKGLNCTDASGNEYKVHYADLDNVFASNVVIAGACTGTTYPYNSDADDYDQKIKMNRINIMIRRGVTAPDGGGEKVGILPTTDHLPKAGDDYTITLERINGGYTITTTDKQTGKTASQTVYEDQINAADLLGIQDPDNIYVGVFAARWADCTVSNISLSETVPVETPKVLYGDVNDDGVVTSADASLLLQQILMGNAEHSEIKDVMADGVIDSADVAAILQHSLDSSYILPR